MRRTVTVDLGKRSYDIDIGDEDRLSYSIPATDGGARALIVTDSNVDPLYGDHCAKVVASRGWNPDRHVVEAGEVSKSLATMAALYDHAAAIDMERRSLVVALGGGVVGDMAGFLAATYMRGIPFVQVPTSLLAMVDSSVGGKTGVNLSAGKNLVGSFYQPVSVSVNLNVLRSLPDREYAAGLAEVVKYGVIQDGAFFSLLEQNVDSIRARDPGLLTEIVARCCEIKADVVTRDETEGGVRAILNFGHTLGHALEAVFGYGDWLHGEAVAAGMVYAARVSERVRGFPPRHTERLVSLLTQLGLPCRWCNRDAGEEPDWSTIRGAMSRDKKTRGTVPRFVLVDEIGVSAYGCVVGEDTLADIYAVG